MNFAQSTRLSLYKWRHEGTERMSEWLLIDEHGTVFFIRRSKTQRLAIGSQGSWRRGDDGVTLHLRQFACTPGATLRDHEFIIVNWDMYRDGIRYILHVAEIHLREGNISWSPTVRNFTRQQWLTVVAQVKEEVLDFVGWTHITVDTQEPSEWRLLL